MDSLLASIRTGDVFLLKYSSEGIPAWIRVVGDSADDPLRTPALLPLVMPVAGPIETRRPLFAWHASRRSESPSYRLLIGTDSLHLEPAWEGFRRDTTYAFDQPLTEGTQYWWRVEAFNVYDELLERSETRSFVVPTGTANEPDLPPALAHTLEQNAPNPFTSGTTIRFTLAKPGSIRLRVYDLTGRVIATVLDGALSAGEHTVVVDGLGLPSGVFYYRLEAANYVATRRMVVVR